MKIRRIILKNVRNFVDFDYTFEDDWTGEIPDALLLVGPNGSGKTTILNSVTDLWELVFDYLQVLKPIKVPQAIQSLPANAVIAIEVTGIEELSNWIIYRGKDVPKTTLISQIPLESHRIYVLPIYSHGPFLSIKYATPEETTLSIAPTSMQLEWQQRWLTILTENVLGKSANLPNIVYLESETRLIPTIEESFSIQPETEEYRWLARYQPTTSRKGSLHNYLYNLRVVDEATFQQIVGEVNTFFPGKRLNGFDRRTGDLLVKTEDGHEHSINSLSSGEKQVLLMLATITRWLRPGGIVLIDEPDLHLHPSLTTAFISHLRRMANEKNGQLIIASHATELWKDFTESHRVELGRLSEMVG